MRSTITDLGTTSAIYSAWHASSVAAATGHRGEGAARQGLRWRKNRQINPLVRNYQETGFWEADIFRIGRRQSIENRTTHYPAPHALSSFHLGIDISGTEKSPNLDCSLGGQSFERSLPWHKCGEQAATIARYWPQPETKADCRSHCWPVH